MPYAFSKNKDCKGKGFVEFAKGWVRQICRKDRKMPANAVFSVISTPTWLKIFLITPASSRLAKALSHSKTQKS
ncbi:hypothetical protein D4L85_04035 [Chryseolinea soli]|uniref:Uncharacterized protein n=1 Tax=Chryseolinea soli TaxID=2321403 RepID=A0A385SL90_9BACT|nr:hypothetical protein D4L85_04035 [Chryseolinea soli]